ncbi:MAG: DUF1467 family protein [Pseudomonadota bacterium]
MNWVTGTLTFVMIWWMVLFVVLPFGTKSYAEEGIEPPRGSNEAAPVRLRLWRKIAITTLVTFIVWACFALFVRVGGGTWVIENLPEIA